jgi:hypothetical protein
MRADNGSIQPLEGVQHSENGTGVQYAAIIPGAEANVQGDRVRGVFDPTAGNVCYKQIKYDASDFLGSCARLPGVNQHSRSSLEACIETGNDYGLGAGMCEAAPDDSMVEDAYVDMERTLQELAQNACVGMGRIGYFTYGCNFQDVADCHASMCWNLTSRRVPFSECKKEGAVSTEFARARRVGHICVETLTSGTHAPTKSETQRAGLTLRSMEQVEIQPWRRVNVTAGLRLFSLRGQRVRVTQSFLGPGDREKMRIRKTFLTPLWSLVSCFKLC